VVRRTVDDVRVCEIAKVVDLNRFVGIDDRAVESNVVAKYDLRLRPPCNQAHGPQSLPQDEAIGADPHSTRPKDPQASIHPEAFPDTYILEQQSEFQLVPESIQICDEPGHNQVGAFTSFPSE
jgi:hypothetical protein